MKENVCPSCFEYLKAVAPANYPNIVKCDNARDCVFHPTLDNWRTRRTLRTILAWSLNGEGYTHPNFKLAAMTREQGWVHRRTAEAVLFDYEKPYLDLLIREKALKVADHGQGAILKLTPKGHKLIRQWAEEKDTK